MDRPDARRDRRPEATEPAESAFPAGETWTDTEPDASDGGRDDTALAPDEDVAAVLAFLSPAEVPGSLGSVGSYPIQAILGRGAMGVVLKAFDKDLQRPVALKVLSPELSSSPSFRERFLREARAAAAINHPNVVTIHAVGEHRGLPYLVMEFIPGRTLAQRIVSEPPLQVVDILRIGVQIADGLESAHRHGLIHRDVKPSNLMLEESFERVRITDFGLARAALDRSGLTSVGRIIGTPAYMSPEQIGGGPIDARSDLFALGCVFWSMATGHSPFRARHMMEIIRKVQDVTPPPLSTVDRRIPDGVSRLVARLLEKDPADRPQSAAEVSAELSRCLADLRRASDDSFAPGLDAAPASDGERPSRRREALLAVAGGVCALLMLGLVLGLGRRSPHARPVPAPAPKRPDIVAVPPAGRVLTVARSGQADYRDLAEALSRAPAGSEVRVLDDGTYEGPLRFDDASRWGGLKLVSPRKATLVAEGPSSVVLISATPGVTIDGFRIRTGARQFGVEVRGESEGVALRRLELHSPASAKWASILLAKGAKGTPARPVVIEDSVVHDGALGLILQGDGAGPVTSIRIRGNRFLGDGATHIQLLQGVRDVQVTFNIFAGGKGLTWMLADPRRSRSIHVANNTFWKTRYWINLDSTSPRIEDVRIGRNLIVGGRAQPSGRPLSEFTGGWAFAGNRWQSDSDDAAMRLVAEPLSTIDFVSVDPDSPNFLVPTDDGVVVDATPGGASPAYAGARPPRRRPRSDAAKPVTLGGVR